MINEKFFNKQDVDYFWEYKYPFGEVFLKTLFPNTYKRKYLIEGDGIVNLIYIDNKIYELDFKQGKSFVENLPKQTNDKNKNNIVGTIISYLEQNNIKYTTKDGKYITFKIGEYIGKIEIVKKLKEPK